MKQNRLWHVVFFERTTMNCAEQKNAIARLVDGALPAAEAKQLRTHIRSCSACRREYHFLTTLAGDIAALPQYQPGREFNGRILIELGLQPIAGRIPSWIKWPGAAGAAISAAWAGLLVYALFSRISVVGALKALQLAVRPQQTLSALGLYSVKLGFAVADAASFLLKTAALALRGSNLPLQLIAATVIALGLISLLSRRSRAIHFR
jgi:hypothetical protein